MMKFNITRSIYNILEGLAYWSANKAITAERYPDDFHEVERCDKTILSLFGDCDRLEIPAPLVNSALYFGSDWRRYKSDDLNLYLARIYEVNYI